MIVAGKQPALDYLTMDEAIAHCTRGIGIWEWASNDEGQEPDVVMALRRRHSDARDGGGGRRSCASGCRICKIRVVNVVDLMRLEPDTEHPHGLPDREFDALFTASRPVIFAYHGYPMLIHRLTYRRNNHDNFHVRGYKEEGTTTTPFDMVMLNDLDRFHLVMDVIDRVPGLGERARTCVRTWPTRGCAPARVHARGRRRPPDVRDWVCRWRGVAAPALPRTLGGPVDRAVAVLVVNAGSSSLKLSLARTGDETLASAELSAPRAVVDDLELRAALGPTVLARPTRSVTGSCTAARGSARRW